MPAASEEQRNDADLLNAFLDKPLRRCHEVRLEVIEECQRDGQRGLPFANAASNTLERLGPARITRAMRVENQPPLLHGRDHIARGNKRIAIDSFPLLRHGFIVASMYRYDSFDQRLVDERVAQFRDQTRRYLAGELTEDDFRPLRLMNGLYIQKYAPMLRISIPYGLLSTRQLRTLAGIGRRYDRGYGHFTTRQNLQFNWPKLEDVPDILAELAAVEMHAIQTSGNCVRNITSDHFAGAAGDEIADPRPYSELVRQWAALNPEFAYLPRKFKIAITAATVDRTALLVHDVGLQIV